MFRGRGTGFLLGLFVLSIAFVFFHPGPGITGKTRLEADQLEITPERTVARGNVNLSREGFTLNCKYLRMERGEGKRKLTAEGEVELTAGGAKIEASSLTGELPGGEGGHSILELSGGSGNFDNFNFEGKKIVLELTGDELSRISLKKDATLSPNERTTLRAEEINLTRADKGWELLARGSARYSGRDTNLRGEKLTGRIESGGGKEGQLKEITVEKLSGETIPANQNGDSGSFSFTGERGDFLFEGPEELTEFRLTKGSFTSCNFRRGEETPAYSLESERLSLLPGDFLVAETAEIKSFGLPVWRSPNYFIPLGDLELPSRSYFPRVGFSGSEGLTFEGAVPVYLNRRNFGNVIADYSTGQKTIGLGLDYFSGGKSFTGVAKLYGKIRSGESNYLGLEAEFDGGPESWPDLTGALDFRRGPLQGEDYDRNEWRLNLTGIDELPGWSSTIARSEVSASVNNSSDTTKRAITRLPEIGYEKEDVLPDLPGQNNFSGKFGYYRERETSWLDDRSATRVDLRGNFSIDGSPLKWLDLSLSSSGRFDGYFFGEVNGLKTRTALDLTPKLELKGPGDLEIRFDHRAKLGNSPFIFDSINGFGKLSFTYEENWRGLYNRLDFHYDFVPSNGFSNLNYELEFQKGILAQEFGLAYDLNKAALEVLTASTGLSRDFGSLEVSTGYDFKTGSITETELGVEFTGARNGFNLQLVGNPPETLLEEISGGIDVTVLENWSISLTGEYDFQDDEISKLSYSVYNTLQNCLKVGVSGGLGGLWFNAELTGF